MAQTALQEERVSQTRNARLVLGKNEPSPEYAQSALRRFEENQSIQAEADRFRTQEAANDAVYRGVSALETQENVARIQQLEVVAAEEAAYRARVAAIAAAEARLRGRNATQSLKKIRPFSWAGLGVAFTLYIWQLVFGLLAALGLLIKNQQVALSEGNLFEKAISFLGSIPAEGMGAIGMLAWGIGMLISIITFVCFFVWFKFQGINPLDTTSSTFWTFLLLALNILPFINIFPWLLIWIVYINLSSLRKGFSTPSFSR